MPLHEPSAVEPPFPGRVLYREESVRNAEMEWVAAPHLTHAERDRLTVQARIAALRCAAKVIASGRSGLGVRDLATEYESWILR